MPFNIQVSKKDLLLKDNLASSVRQSSSPKHAAHSCPTLTHSEPIRVGGGSEGSDESPAGGKFQKHPVHPTTGTQRSLERPPMQHRKKRQE